MDMNGSPVQSEQADEGCSRCIGHHTVCICVCVCVCVLCRCVEDRKELELRGVCPRHLCVRPPRYTCTSIRAVIIDTWPANYWF